MDIDNKLGEELNPNQQKQTIPSKPTKLSSLLIAVLIVVIGVGAVGYGWNYHNNTSKYYQQEQSQPTEQTLSGWKEYENDYLSFKYHPDWILEESHSEDLTAELDLKSSPHNHDY